MISKKEIDKANEVLRQREDMVVLVSRDGERMGKIVSCRIGTEVGVGIDLVGSRTISLSTLEKWIKQIKKAKKAGII